VWADRVAAASGNVQAESGYLAGDVEQKRLVLADGFVIHGTNKPGSIGKAVSRGCVRTRKADIERLDLLVPVGTPVYMI
jgi:cytoskeletal protein CcmA (bactofilin family)